MATEKKHIDLLLAKVETTEGTDPTPTPAANAIPCIRDSIKLEPMSTPVIRKIADAGQGALAGANSLVHWKLSFQCEIAGNRATGAQSEDITEGTSTYAVRVDALLRACGMAAAYSAETSTNRDGYVIYTPTADDSVTATFYFYSGLKLHKITAAKGTFKINKSVGKFGVFEFTFFGKYNAPTDVALSGISGMVYGTALPQPFAGSAITLGSYAPVLSAVSFDLGNNVQPRMDATEAYGIKGFAITGRETVGTLDPEATTEAAQPFYADWAACTGRTLTVPVGLATSGVSGNRYSTIATIEPRGLSNADRNEVRTHGYNFGVVKTGLTIADGQEFQLKFY